MLQSQVSKSYEKRQRVGLILVETIGNSNTLIQLNIKSRQAWYQPAQPNGNSIIWEKNRIFNYDWIDVDKYKRLEIQWQLSDVNAYLCLLFTKNTMINIFEKYKSFVFSHQDKYPASRSVWVNKIIMYIQGHTALEYLAHTGGITELCKQNCVLFKNTLYICRWSGSNF